MFITMLLANMHPGWRESVGDVPLNFGTFWWWAYGGISVFLVCFAGIMSGLTLGLMSLGLMDIEVLQRSGTATEKRQAAAILPVVQKQHQLLVTLLLSNAVAMEALPIFLDRMFNEWVAVILSVTFVLAFGEVMPQAICSRFGLAVGANMVWLVKILMWICFPVAYPVGLILDYLLGHDDSALFRRSQLKALVSIHGKEAGGYLTHDETTIISGALDLTLKTVEEAMTPIESAFSVDINSKLDWEAMGKILARGHSRVPVYTGSPHNIVGLLLVKSLLTVRAEDNTPVSSVSIRRMPRVPANLPLYDMLNEFQKGSSHMAAVVKTKSMMKKPSTWGIRDIHKKGLKGNEVTTVDVQTGDLENQQQREKTNHTHLDEGHQCSSNGIREENRNGEDSQVQISPRTAQQSEDIEDLEGGDVIGIITMEDVMEELLQEEIVDETDEYIDVHRRIRVVASAHLKRSSSVGRLCGSVQSPTMGLSKQGQQAVTKGRVEALSGVKTIDSLTRPLLAPNK